jgi:hypothetical protein
MRRYWIGVACKEHVKGAVQGGFAQVCHGKAGPLSRMQEGDWIVYYSPTLKFGGKEACQCFTAIGKIKSGQPYTFAMSEDFVPWRRDVAFLTSEDAPIRPLITSLSFIHDKNRWGFPFRKGCFEISANDFNIIAQGMGIPKWKNL